jgi:ABC-type dipeptide/oligopeptide/nickel transport system ATPase subunit
LTELIRIRDPVITYPSARGPLRTVDDVGPAIDQGEAFGLEGESATG